MDDGFHLFRDLRVGLEGQGDSHLRASSRDIWEGRQGDGLANGRQHPHHALWVVMGFILMAVVMVMVVVLMLVQVRVFVVMVQSEFMVMLMGVLAISMLVGMVVVG